MNPVVYCRVGFYTIVLAKELTDSPAQDVHCSAGRAWRVIHN